MRTYQIILVVKTGSDAERKKTLDFVTNLLKGAKVKEEDLGSKALAYQLKHEMSGHFYELIVEEETLPAGFEKKLLENENILRHIVLRK